MTSRTNRPLIRGLVAFTAWLALVAAAVAAEPTLRSMDIRGLQIGATTTLTIDGEDLGATPRLLLPIAARQELKPGNTDKRAIFDVTTDAAAVAGLHQVRIITEAGVSLPVIVGVDRLPQQPLAPTVAALPVALHGSIGGPAIVETTFTGKAGDKILIEVDAQRLGSKLRPIIHLSNTQRRQLGWSWGTPALAGDARLAATLPADGNYIVAVHDAEYSPPSPGFFRLRIGSWSYVDQVFPPVVSLGKPGEVEFLGMSPVPRAAVAASAILGAAPLPWPADSLWSGPRPGVFVSPHTEVVEQPPATGVQELPTGAVGVCGRLLTAFEEDRYRLPVTPGTKVRLEVFAERYGSPLDAAIIVRNEAGDTLVRAEDGPGMLDPVLEFAVPGNVNYILVGVVDAQGRGGPRGVYRLAVDPRPASTVDDRFQLKTAVQRMSLATGGRWVVPVYVDRRGASGNVDLAAPGLPAGIQIAGATIPDGADGTLLAFERGEGPFEPAVVSLRGRSQTGHEEPVVLSGHPLAGSQPWLASEIAVAPSSAKAADFQIDWRGLSSDAGIVPTARLALPVKLTRPAGAEVVRLTLLTSQPTIILNGQPDPNRALRPEKPVELAAAAVEGEFGVLTPPELPASVYDVTIQAELLSADKQRVLATSFAPVRRMPVKLPLAVQLAGAPQLEATLEAGKGATVMIAGKIERKEGLTGDVAVTLTGLPAGARADAVTVKADATDFVLNLVLPAQQPAGEFKGLKLSANGPGPGNPALRVRTRDLDLTLVVKPPAAK